MKNAETLYCKDCKFYKKESVSPVKMGVNFSNKLSSRRGRIITQEHKAEILKKIANAKIEGGIISCGDEETKAGAFKTCDKEFMYSPRKDLKYWLSFLQNTANQFSKFIPKP